MVVAGNPLLDVDVAITLAQTTGRDAVLLETGSRSMHVAMLDRPKSKLPNAPISTTSKFT